MLNILHFISSPAAGGAEVYIKDLSINMASAGHQISIVFLQSAAQGGRDLNYEKKFLAELSNHNIKYFFLGIGVRKNIIKGGLALRSIIIKQSIDIVHCHLYYALAFSLFFWRVPVVYTHHSIKLNIPKAAYRIFDLRVSRYIAICQSCNDMLFGISKKPVVQINNAVSASRVQPKMAFATMGTVSLVFVGRLCDAKNIPFLIEICSDLRGLDFKLTIAGEGPDRDYLESLVADLSLQDKIIFVGNIDDVSDFLAQADIFVMSSAWEGLPIALIEATLTGLPVLVTDVGGCPEIVDVCKNGYSVSLSDPVLYKEKLINLIEDSQLRRRLSDNAVKYSQRYTMPVAADAHISLYEQIILRD